MNKYNLTELSEAIQEDLICCLSDLLDEEDMNQVCQIVVNRINSFIAKYHKELNSE